MEWKRYSTGSDFERTYSYSRALFDDDWVFVSGTTGFDYRTMELAEDAADQARQMLRNIEGALESCGSSLAEVYNYLLIVSDRASVPAVLEVVASAFPGKPTGTLMVAGLLEERIKVELEVRTRKGWTSSTS